MIKVVYITGYKPYELQVYNASHPAIAYIKKAFSRRLAELVEDGLEWVITSGQTGVEQWGAEVVFDLKKMHSQLKLGIFLPYLEQEEKWQEQTKEQYDIILSKADYVNTISKKKYEGPWQLKAKTKFMVEKSDALLIFYDEEAEGSPRYILNEAKDKHEKTNYPIHQITFSDLQSLQEEEMWDNIE